MKFNAVFHAAAVFTGVLLFAAAVPVSAQSTEPALAPIQSQRYVLYYTPGVSNPENLPAMCESYFDTFNNIFRFSPDGPGFPYTVRAFASPEEYGQYAFSKTGTQTNSTAAYIRYSRPEKSEVIFVQGSPMLPRQLLAQYLYSFSEAPAPWLTGGFSLYTENLAWTKEKGVYAAKQENPWLETAKKLALDPSISLNAVQILEAEAGTYPADRLYPQAWLLVSFLMETPDPGTGRLLWDGIAQGARREDFLGYMKTWLQPEQLNEQFRSFVSSLKTTGELTAEAVSLYNAGDDGKAAALFTDILQSSPDDPAACYYMGLIAYRNARYAEAETWYKKAARNGADAALVNWALGLSAYSDKRYTEAKNYLNEAKKLDGEQYGRRADELVAQIP